MTGGPGNQAAAEQEFEELTFGESIRLRLDATLGQELRCGSGCQVRVADRPGPPR
jgi:hypothetical protein